MNSRRDFIKTGSMLGAATLLSRNIIFAKSTNDFTSMRPPLAQRNFTSDAVEEAIKNMKAFLPNKELAWLFENCFPIL
jgi:hypothetical protein